MVNGLENHSPNSYFHYYTDDNGDSFIKYDNNGNVYINITSENKSLTYLHGFVCFVLNKMSDNEKEKVVDLLSVTLAVAMDSNYTKNIDGVVYSKDNLMEFILDNEESASIVIAYLLKYADTYNLTEWQVFRLLRAFGLEDIANVVQASLFVSPKLRNALSGGENLLGALIAELKDGKEDKIIQFFLLGITKLLKSKGIDFNIDKFWKMIETEYEKIGNVDALSARKNASIKNEKIYVFSKKAYEELLATILEIERNVFEDISEWDIYKDEEWYESLFIDIAKNGIKKYADRLTDINISCKNQIDEIFQNEWQIDLNYAKKIKTLNLNVEKARNAYQLLAETLG